MNKETESYRLGDYVRFVTKDKKDLRLLEGVIMCDTLPGLHFVNVIKTNNPEREEKWLMPFTPFGVYTDTAKCLIKENWEYEVLQKASVTNKNGHSYYVVKLSEGYNVLCVNKVGTMGWGIDHDSKKAIVESYTSSVRGIEDSSASVLTEAEALSELSENDVQEIATQVDKDLEAQTSSYLSIKNAEIEKRGNIHASEVISNRNKTMDDFAQEKKKYVDWYQNSIGDNKFSALYEVDGKGFRLESKSGKLYREETIPVYKSYTAQGRVHFLVPGTTTVSDVEDSSSAQVTIDTTQTVSKDELDPVTGYPTGRKSFEVNEPAVSQLDEKQEAAIRDAVNKVADYYDAAGRVSESLATLWFGKGRASLVYRYVYKKLGYVGLDNTGKEIFKIADIDDVTQQCLLISLTGIKNKKRNTLSLGLIWKSTTFAFWNWVRDRFAKKRVSAFYEKPESAFDIEDDEGNETSIFDQEQFVQSLSDDLSVDSVDLKNSLKSTALNFLTDTSKQISKTNKNVLINALYAAWVATVAFGENTGLSRYIEGSANDTESLLKGFTRAYSDITGEEIPHATMMRAIRGYTKKDTGLEVKGAEDAVARALGIGHFSMSARPFYFLLDESIPIEERNPISNSSAFYKIEAYSVDEALRRFKNEKPQDLISGRRESTSERDERLQAYRKWDSDNKARVSPKIYTKLSTQQITGQDKQLNKEVPMVIHKEEFFRKKEGGWTLAASTYITDGSNNKLDYVIEKDGSIRKRPAPGETLTKAELTLYSTAPSKESSYKKDITKETVSKEITEDDAEREIESIKDIGLSECTEIAASELGVSEDSLSVPEGLVKEASSAAEDLIETQEDLLGESLQEAKKSKRNIIITPKNVKEIISKIPEKDLEAPLDGEMDVYDSKITF